MNIISYFAVPGLRGADMDTFKEEKVYKLDLQCILNKVAEETNVSISQIAGRAREQHVVEARHIYYFLAKRYTKQTLKKIGGYINGRDHTSVLHGIKSISNYTQNEPELRMTIARIENRLEF